VSVWTPFSLADPAPLRCLRFFGFLAAVRAETYVQRALSPWSGAIAAFCRLRGARFVYMTANDGESDGTHIVYRRPVSKALSGLALRLADAVVVQNEYQRRNLAPRRRGPLFLLPASWEMPAGEPAYDAGSVVLWVGRLDRNYKQPELFLDLARRFPAERFEMIAPPANDQLPYHRRIAAEAAKLPNVSFLPGVALAEADAHYRRAKALVNTSASEGFPNTFLQAAANKTPIISLNADPDSFIEKHRCGFVCRGDFELMAGRLADLLRDERLRGEMAANAFRYVREHHDAAGNAAALAGILRSVGAGEPRSAAALAGEAGKGGR
jgi:glycosyltransferase involved in cell wall biosynthesis